MPDLFHFDWYVDQHGYEEVVYERNALDTGNLMLDWRKEGEFIRGKGGPLRAYRPLEDFPGLHRRFAKLPTDTPAILEFIHMFGLLGSGFSEPGLGEEDLAGWRTSIAIMERLVYEIDAGKRDEACNLFNKHVHPRLSIRIEREPGRRPQPQIVPFSLEGALYIQLLDELTTALKFKRCKQCPNWFSYGSGTGRRETKEFCSDRCRMARNRENKRRATTTLRT